MSYTWGAPEHYLMRLTVTTHSSGGRKGKEWSWRCSCKEAEGITKDRATAHAEFGAHLKEIKK